MKKLVNITAVRNVRGLRTLTPIRRGTHYNILMSTSDILTCINEACVVDEILKDGRKVRLNAKNYASNNENVVKPTPQPVVKPEPVKEEPVVPVQEEVKTEAVVEETSKPEFMSKKERRRLERQMMAEQTKTVETEEVKTETEEIINE